MDASTSPVVYTNSAADKFFRKRYTSTVSFAVGILLFLLPFAELKCTSVTLADNTGFGIAMGKSWRVVDTGAGNEIMGKLKSTIQDPQKGPFESAPNVFVIVALAAAFFGLVITLVNQKMKAIIGLCAGILAALMLIALVIQFKILTKSLTSGKEDGELYDISGILKVQFTYWFYFSLAAFAAAAFFSYKHHQIELEDAMANFVDFEFQRKDAAP